MESRLKNQSKSPGATIAMTSRRLFFKNSLALGLTHNVLGKPFDSEPVDYAAKAREIHKTAILFDGHNDLPWQLREQGQIDFQKVDLATKQSLPYQTDIPRMRQGGLNAQFWSVYIPGKHPNPLRTVLEQIDIVHRMIQRYPNDFEQAFTAADVRRIAKSGKCASMIGVEGGVAIENDLSMLRILYSLGTRYMTLTHNQTLDWAEAATDKPKNDGLSPFGVRVVKEMNRLGMLVDISHVSVSTMSDVLDSSKAPVIASHSSAFALCPHPRNINDDILRRLRTNGGLVMINFFSSFIVPGAAAKVAAKQADIQKTTNDKTEVKKQLEAWLATQPELFGTIHTVVEHIEHVARVAGVDHVGLGSDFDGINRWPKGLDSVADFPKITEELLRRGHSEANVRKILGENALRVLAQAEKVARQMQSEIKPEIDPPVTVDTDH